MSDCRASRRSPVCASSAPSISINWGSKLSRVSYISWCARTRSLPCMRFCRWFRRSSRFWFASIRRACIPFIFTTRREWYHWWDSSIISSKNRTHWAFRNFQMPGLLVEPVLFATIIYWLAGLRPTIDAFGSTILVVIFTMNVSIACGKQGVPLIVLMI